MLFSFVWTTLVYCPLAYWVWAPEGWAFKWGVLDFSGGGPVEIGSGVGGFAYALVLGKRKESQMINFRYAQLHVYLFQNPRLQAHITCLTSAACLLFPASLRFALLLSTRVYNVSFISLGTFLLWVGWLGFNAVSAFGANLRAVYAAWNTTICAAAVSILSVVLITMRRTTLHLRLRVLTFRAGGCCMVHA